MKFNLSLKRPKDDKTTVVLIAFIDQRRFKTGLGVREELLEEGDESLSR